MTSLNQSHKRTGPQIYMNSTEDRRKHEELTKRYGPGPGHYAVKSSAFQNEYINQGSPRRLVSQDTGSRIPGKPAKTTHSSHRESTHPQNESGRLKDREKWLSGNESGYPSYTVRENGSLRKRLQPFAADQVKRNVQFDASDQGASTRVAPGSYDVPATFDILAR